MKKYVFFALLLAANSAFAQQVTVTEPEFINSFSLLTSDSTLATLPKENGTIGQHSSKTKKLAKWLGISDDTVFGFASPGGEMTAEALDSMENYGRRGLLYMRCDMRILRQRRLKLFARKVSRIIKFPPIYRYAFSDTLMTDCPDRTVYSDLVLNGNTASQIISLINLAVKKKAALTLTFHTIAFTDDDDKWSWSAEKLEKVCDRLVALRDGGKADVLTSAELYERIR